MHIVEIISFKPLFQTVIQLGNLPKHQLILRKKVNDMTTREYKEKICDADCDRIIKCYTDTYGSQSDGWVSISKGKESYDCCCLSCALNLIENLIITECGGK